jgi:hypothetical protein
MSSRAKSGWLGVLLGVCACGGVSRVDAPGLGNGTAGGDNAGRAGDELGGGASGGRSSAGASAGGAGGVVACGQFKDQAPQSARVLIANDTSDPIYIGPREQTCGPQPLYEVRDASNANLPAPGSCDSPCQGWLAGNPVGGCPTICFPSEVTQLAAGDVLSLPWAGLYQLEAELPNACNAAQQLGGSVTCTVDKRIEPGSYTFYAHAGSGYRCDDTAYGNTGYGCGECVPSTTGGCVLHGAIVTGAETSAQLTVQLDPGYGISGSAGSGNPSGDPLPIEVVFRAAP